MVAKRLFWVMKILSDAILCVYCLDIHSVLEYACPVRRPGLTKNCLMILIILKSIAKVTVYSPFTQSHIK